MKNLFADLKTSSEKTGTFITFEGIDASGKGTQFVKIVNYFYELSKVFSDIFIFREPTYNEYGYKQRVMLQKDSDPAAGLEECVRNFVLDRKSHQHIILDTLKRDCGLVFGDRYFDSTFSYQVTQMDLLSVKSEGQPLSREKKLEAINRLIKTHTDENIIKPDITILVDIEIDVALKRLSFDSTREKREKFEEPLAMKYTRENYLLIAELDWERVKVVNGDDTKDNVFKKIKAILVPFIYRRCSEHLKPVLEKDILKREGKDWQKKWNL